MDGNTTNHPLSHSFSSGHYKSKSSNDVPFRSGTPANAVYHVSSGHAAPSNAPGSTYSSLPTAYPSYSRCGSPYDSRIYRHPDIEQISTRESSESQTVGSSMMHSSCQETPVPSSSVAKYECSYCGKGFNRPSSLKVSLSGFSIHQSMTAQMALDTYQQSYWRKT
jgi:hypothetical protein